MHFICLPAISVPLSTVLLHHPGSIPTPRKFSQPSPFCSCHLAAQCCWRKPCFCPRGHHIDSVLSQLSPPDCSAPLCYSSQVSIFSQSPRSCFKTHHPPSVHILSSFLSDDLTISPECNQEIHLSSYPYFLLFPLF